VVTMTGRATFGILSKESGLASSLVMKTESVVWVSVLTAWPFVLEVGIARCGFGPKLYRNSFNVYTLPSGYLLVVSFLKYLSIRFFGIPFLRN
jgi:hypothetical protein